MRKIRSAAEALKRLETLPPDIQKLIYSTDMLAILKEVGGKNRLHIDQLSLLEAEAGNVMLGFTEPDELVNAIVEGLSLERPAAESVVRDLDALLFSKIRESLKKVRGEERLVSAEVAPAANRTNAAVNSPRVAQQPASGTPFMRTGQTSAAPQPQKPAVPAPQTPRPAAPAPQAPRPTAPMNLPVGEAPIFGQRTASAMPAPAQSPAPARKPEVLKPQAPQVPAKPPSDISRDPFAGPSVSKEQKVDVGLPQQKPNGYKTDPYRELPE